MKTRYAAVAALLAGSLALKAWSADPTTPARGNIPAGYRGFSLPLPGDQAAFVKKGDRVDVMVTFDTELKDRKEKVTATLLQNVVVVGVLSGKLEDKAALELLLNPNETQFLALGLMQGVIHIALRAEGDKEMHPMEMASFRKLFR